MSDVPTTMRQLRSIVTSDGRLQLSIDDVPVPAAGPGEVLLRVEAAPINPSDLGLLIATADLRAAVAGGTPDHPTVAAPIPPQTLQGLAGRFDESMPVGNEGSGTVVAVGEGVDSSLLGRLVGFVGGASYGEYRNVSTMSCIEVPEGTQPEQAAACFVNPLTALGMVETMRMEGHSAIVHTAAASNLGQMLNRLCISEGVPLVNVVRKAEQEALLEGRAPSTSAIRASRRSATTSPRPSPPLARRSRSTPSAEGRRARRSCRASKLRRRRRRPPTAATAATRSSSSTSTAHSTAAPPS